MIFPRQGCPWGGSGASPNPLLDLFCDFQQKQALHHGQTVSGNLQEREMSEIHTFYAPDLAAHTAAGTSGDQTAETCTHIVLEGQECKHLVSVLRLGPGAEVRIMDGMGHVARARVEQTDKKKAILSLMDVQAVPRPSSLPVMALAFSKAVRRGFFLEKAVELGAHEVWLWQGDHSQGKLPADARDSWQAKMIAGCKQSSNPWLPNVRAFSKGLAEVVDAARDFEQHILPWEMQHDVPMVTVNELGQPGRTIYIIGPEGGFSQRELDLLSSSGYRAVSFGQRILRCETAATLCLGLHWWASQQKGRPDAPHGQEQQ